MPTVMRSSHPSFRIHDRHPALRGLAWLVLCLVLVMAFLASVMSGVQAPAPSRAGAERAGPVHG